MAYQVKEKQNNTALRPIYKFFSASRNEHNIDMFANT